MIIRNQENKDTAINTDLVNNFYKTKNKYGVFQILFGYSAMGEEEVLYDLWSFTSEEERDNTYENIMMALDGQWL